MGFVEVTGATNRNTLAAEIRDNSIPALQFIDRDSYTARLTRPIVHSTGTCYTADSHSDGRCPRLPAMECSHDFRRRRESSQNNVFYLYLITQVTVRLKSLNALTSENLR